MAIEPINDFEQRLRRRKAERLADAYYERATAMCRSIDGIMGSDVPVTDIDDATRILAMVHEARPRMWMSLAHTEKIALPSTRTMALAQSLVADRAHQIRGDYR